jgi:hypothetical protein
VYQRAMTKTGPTLALTLAVAVAGGCHRKPVTAPRAIIPETTPSQLRVAATSARKFGDMVAIGVGFSSGAPGTYVVSASRIFAVDGDGNRVAALSVEEASRQAGGTTALVAGLRGAGGGALLTGLLGAIPGAIIGAAQNGGSGAGTGAAVGAGIGVAVGAVGGFYDSKTKTDEETQAQLRSLYFGEKTLETGIPVSGFVFFPAGTYVGVRAVAVEKATKHVEDVFGPIVRPETMSRVGGGGGATTRTRVSVVPRLAEPARHADTRADQTEVPATQPLDHAHWKL